MPSWARVTALAVVVCLLGACTGRVARSPDLSPPIGTPARSATPLHTAAPCTDLLALLGAYTRRLTADIGALQPIVAAPAFDNGSALNAIRVVSNTLRTFAGLETALEPCEGPFQLAQRLAQVRSAAETAVTTAVSVYATDSQAHHDAAVALLALLPKVNAISTDAGKLTNGLGLGAALSTAHAYSASALKTYGTDVRKAVPALVFIDCSGLTDAECAPLNDAGASWVKVAVASIDDHLAFMRDHPPATCFTDAYGDDRAIANGLISALSDWSAGRGAGKLSEDDKIQAAMAAATDFLSRIESYFNDCG